MDMFEIKDLRCSYPPNGKPVLFIEKLAIQKGRLTVILGRSGSGKSTLVEALGLMNNTIREGKVSYFSPGGVIDLVQTWKKRRMAANIRRNYFSFIFQDDYLMPYYTCRENMLISRLMQEKVAPVQADSLLNGLLQSLDLAGNDLLKQMPGQLAGGQKQRISFIRAAIKNFDVLFGDEPTGNLDAVNSEKLFGFIKTTIIERSCSAVIVTHNVGLAVEKADRIIVLAPSERPAEAPFSLRPDHVFDRDSEGSWAGYSVLQDFTKHLKSIL